VKIPKLHSNFKIGGLLIALVGIAAQIAAITGGIQHPSPTVQAINSACITIGLIGAALGVHPGDSTQ
jgi:hypothetical protein